MPSNKPGYQAEYIKKHYLENKQYYKDRAKKRRKELAEWFREYKKTLVCVKCGESFWMCLDFHHVNPAEKEYSFNYMISRGHGKKRIMRELAKCVVLCANCHRKLHGGLLDL